MLFGAFRFILLVAGAVTLGVLSASLSFGTSGPEVARDRVEAPAPNDNMEVSKDEIARLLRHIVGVQ
jgi:hypothetical protein